MPQLEVGNEDSYLTLNYLNSDAVPPVDLSAVKGNIIQQKSVLHKDFDGVQSPVIIPKRLVW